MHSLLASTLFSLLSPTFALPHTAINIPVPRALPLKSSCAPGGNFDLSSMILQLPTGSSNGNIDSVSATELGGCSGYTSEYFSTSSNGALILKVPVRSECFTTANSQHCRTELREQKERVWSPKGEVNRLRVKLSVPVPDDSEHGTVIGQIHVNDDDSKKPVCELFYNKKGQLWMGVEQIPDKSSLKMNDLGIQVPKNQTFTYEIRYEKSKLAVAINDAEFQPMDTGAVKDPMSYFKVGNYNQGNSKSEVIIYEIDVKHS